MIIYVRKCIYNKVSIQLDTYLHLYSQFIKQNCPCGFNFRFVVPYDLLVVLIFHIRFTQATSLPDPPLILSQILILFRHFAVDTTCLVFDYKRCCFTCFVQVWFIKYRQPLYHGHQVQTTFISWPPNPVLYQSDINVRATQEICRYELKSWYMF